MASTSSTEASPPCQLLSAYERIQRADGAARDALGDSTLTVPETGNGIPDILDEAKWELDFMMSMTVPEGDPYAGMVHHKVHDFSWTGLPLKPADDANARYLHRPVHGGHAQPCRHGGPRRAPV